MATNKGRKLGGTVGRKHDNSVGQHCITEQRNNKNSEPGVPLYLFSKSLAVVPCPVKDNVAISVNRVT